MIFFCSFINDQFGFSFVPLAKCGLNLVDVRALNQSVPTTNPEINSVEKSMHSIPFVFSLFPSDYFNSSSNTLLCTSRSNVIHANVTNAIKTT